MLYRRRRASRSDSSRTRMSFSRTGKQEALVGERAIFRSMWTSQSIPGPLTLRMMERVVSSMNSTRTWVTPPREPSDQRKQLSASAGTLAGVALPIFCLLHFALRHVPVRPRTRGTLTSLTGAFEESIFATDGLCGGWENRSPGQDAEGILSCEISRRCSCAEPKSQGCGLFVFPIPLVRQNLPEPPPR